jgi:hypothetical protein
MFLHIMVDQLIFYNLYYIGLEYTCIKNICNYLLKNKNIFQK